MFLNDHKVAENEYELSGGITPFSIRDQIVRSVAVVDNLVLAGKLSCDESRRVLVIGGGVAGVAAALRAWKYGMHVAIIEETDELFSRLAKCTTRRIDPTLYDWPSPHWRVNQWNGKSWNGPPIGNLWDLNALLPYWNVENPLPFVADSSANVVYNWQQLLPNQNPNPNPTPNDLRWAEFKNRRYIGRQCRQQVNAPVLRNIEQPEFLFVPETEWCGETNETNEESARVSMLCERGFHVILYATGPGAERCSLKPVGTADVPFEGRLFWEDDLLQDINSFKEKGIFIGGSGDGALQDYIRAVTRKHPAEVIDVLDKHLKGHSEWHELQTVILATRENATRQYSPGLLDRNRQISHEDLINQAVHNTISHLVKDIMTLYRREIDQSLSPLIQPDTLPKRVHLVVRKNYFTACYPLNHFLTLLLSRYLDSKNIGPTLLYNVSIRGVTPSAIQTTTGGQPTTPIPKPGTVTFVSENRLPILLSYSRTELTSDEIGGLPTGTVQGCVGYLYEEPYEEVVLRLGIKPVMPLYNTTLCPYLRRRQILPMNPRYTIQEIRKLLP